jgi:hypothetical protein
MPKLFTQSGLPVPFIAPWSQEGPLPYRLTVNRKRLSYDDEIPQDRDPFNTLWVRYRSNPGQGKATFPGTHPHRQRMAVVRNLCQVGGGQLGEGKQLYLMSSVAGQAGERELTWIPPICPKCALTSVAACPRLGGYTAALTHGMFWGVMGHLYDLRTLQRITSNPVLVSYEDPRIVSMLATRLIVELHDVETVTLDSVASLPSGCTTLEHSG